MSDEWTMPNLDGVKWVEVSRDQGSRQMWSLGIVISSGNDSIACRVMHPLQDGYSEEFIEMCVHVDDPRLNSPQFHEMLFSEQDMNGALFRLLPTPEAIERRLAALEEAVLALAGGSEAGEVVAKVREAARPTRPQRKGGKAPPPPIERIQDVIPQSTVIQDPAEKAAICA